MSKMPSKKSSQERRKRPRGPRAPAKAASTRATPSPKKKAKAPVRVTAAPHTAEEPRSNLRQSQEDRCRHCERSLKNEDKALFVEEEVGRIFCSEECITQYFGSEIDRLEKEYYKHVAPGDLSDKEREKLAHLRWMTLEEPDELWRQKTLAGDFRYTLISEFHPDGKRPVWYICICLFLRGEPSFLYLAFPTRNPAMVDHYRRGERVVWVRPDKAAQAGASRPEDAEGHAISSAPETARVIDGLAGEWTEEEKLRAQTVQERRPDDIPAEDFRLYDRLIEEALDAPDEVWSFDGEGGTDSVRHYHFIRFYPVDPNNELFSESPGLWFVIVARDLDNYDREQIEILDAFPTRDSSLVDRYRKGTQDVGAAAEAATVSRLVH